MKILKYVVPVCFIVCLIVGSFQSPVFSSAPETGEAGKDKGMRDFLARTNVTEKELLKKAQKASKTETANLLAVLQASKASESQDKDIAEAAKRLEAAANKGRLMVLPEAEFVGKDRKTNEDVYGRAVELVDDQGNVTVVIEKEFLAQAQKGLNTVGLVAGLPHILAALAKKSHEEGLLYESTTLTRGVLKSAELQVADGKGKYAPMYDPKATQLERKAALRQVVVVDTQEQAKNVNTLVDEVVDVKSFTADSEKYKDAIVTFVGSKKTVLAAAKTAYGKGIRTYYTQMSPKLTPIGQKLLVNAAVATAVSIWTLDLDNATHKAQLTSILNSIFGKGEVDLSVVRELRQFKNDKLLEIVALPTAGAEVKDVMFYLQKVLDAYRKA